MLGGLVENERPADEHTILALRASVDDGTKEIRSSCWRARRVEKKASVAVNELAV